MSENSRGNACDAYMHLQDYIDTGSDGDPSKPNRVIDYRTPNEVIAEALAAFDTAVQNPPFIREQILGMKPAADRAYARRVSWRCYRVAIAKLTHTPCADIGQLSVYLDQVRVAVANLPKGQTLTKIAEDTLVDLIKLVTKTKKITQLQLQQTDS